MIPKNHRYSFRYGVPKSSLSTPFFVFRYHRNADLTYKLAIVVSKKIDKRAVKRNFIKRMYSEQMRNLIEKNNTQLDIIIYVRKAGGELSAAELYSHLDSAIKKATHKDV